MSCGLVVSLVPYCHGYTSLNLLIVTTFLVLYGKYFDDFHTVPSSDELKRLMQLHGGAFQHYYGKSRVTHIIATMLPHTKLKKLTDEKVVRPEWILDRYDFTEFLTGYSCYHDILNTSKLMDLLWL